MATERIQIPIDRFGRVVLPKSLRERLRLLPGTELEVEERDDAVFLKPVTRQAKVIKKKGILVIASTGETITREDVNEIRDKIRREREEKMWR